MENYLKKIFLPFFILFSSCEFSTKSQFVIETFGDSAAAITEESQNFNLQCSITKDKNISCSLIDYQKKKLNIVDLILSRESNFDGILTQKILYYILNIDIKLANDSILKMDELIFQFSISKDYKSFIMELSDKRSFSKLSVTQSTKTITIDVNPFLSNIIFINENTSFISNSNVNIHFSNPLSNEAVVENSETTCTNSTKWLPITKQVLDYDVKDGSWSGDGTLKNGNNVTIWAKMRSKEYFTSRCSSATVLFDNSPPQNSSISISQGNLTNSLNVNLNLLATDARKMFITESDNCLSESIKPTANWINYVTSKSWKLTNENAINTINVRFRDAAGNMTSTCKSASINHNSQAPQDASAKTATQYTKAITTSLNLSATGATKFSVSSTKSLCNASSDWIKYISHYTVDLTKLNSTNDFYIKFQNSAKNETSCLKASIIQDTLSPTNPSNINDGFSASVTASPEISFTKSIDLGSGIDHYEIAIGSSTGSINDTLDWTSIGTTISNYIASDLNLTWGETYYAGIKAIDNLGFESAEVYGNGFLVGWLQEAYLKPTVIQDSTIQNYNFGQSIAMGDNVIAVGASMMSLTDITVPCASPVTETKTGAVYVFQRANGVWTLVDTIEAPYGSNGGGDQFGFSVALSGTTLAVGSVCESSETNTIIFDTDLTAPKTLPSDDANAFMGAVYIFEKQGSSWNNFKAYIKAPNNANGPAVGDLFGYSIALKNDLLLVGAINEDDNGSIQNTASPSTNELALNSGAAYILKRTTSNNNRTWAHQAFLKASNVEAGDLFGFSVAIANATTVAIGAILEDSNTATSTSSPLFGSPNNSASNAGAVYTFTLSAGVWSQAAYVKPLNLGSGDKFGWSLSYAGTRLSVGAPFEDSDSTDVNEDSSSSTNNLTTNSGAVYIFSPTYVESSFIKPGFTSNAGSGRQFGYSLGYDSNRLIIGSIGNDSNSSSINLTGDDNNTTLTDSGSAYIYTLDFTAAGYVNDPPAFFKFTHLDSNDNVGNKVGIYGGFSAASTIIESSSKTGVTMGQDGSSVNSSNHSGAVFLIKD